MKMITSAPGKVKTRRPKPKPAAKAKATKPKIKDGPGRPGTVIDKPRNVQELLAVTLKAARGSRKSADCCKAAKIGIGYWNKIERAMVKAVPLKTMRRIAAIFPAAEAAKILAAYVTMPKPGDKPFVGYTRNPKPAKQKKTKKTKGTK